MAISTPGETGALGTMRLEQTLTKSQGANAGLFLHPHGHRLLAVRCGALSGFDFWSTSPPAGLQSSHLEVELADLGVQIEPELLPPGSEAGLATAPPHVQALVDASMSASGEVVAFAAGRGVRMARVSDDDSHLLPLGTLRGHAQAVARVALSSRGDRLISCDCSGIVAIWNTSEPEPKLRLQLSRVPRVARFIWNDMLAMVGDDFGRVICWETQTGRRHLQFQAHRAAIFGAAFSAERGILLTSGADGCARLWDLEQGAQVGRDMPHRAAICGLSFAQGGRFVVTCSVDGYVAVWDGLSCELLDWYRDTEPAIHLAVRRVDGAVFVSGMQSIKALAVDWSRLAAMDSTTRASLVITESAADHAARYAAQLRAPAATYREDPYQAPVGAILQARQTTDLPMPDMSALAVPRGGPGGAAPPPMPGRPIAHAQPAAGGSPYFGMPAAYAAGMPSNGVGPGSIQSAVTAPTSIPPMPGALGPGGRALTGALPAIGPIPPMPGAGPSTAALGASVPVRRLPDEPAATVAPVRESGTLSPQQSTETQQSKEQAMNRVLRDLQSPSAPPVKTGMSLSSGAKQRLLIGLAVTSMLAFAAWFGTGRYYRTTGVPGELVSALEGIESKRNSTVSKANADYAAADARQKAQIEKLRAERALAESEIERVRRNTEIRLSGDAQKRDEIVAKAEAEYEKAIEGLSGRRQTIASELAMRSLYVVFGIGFLVSLVLAMRRREDEA